MQLFVIALVVAIFLHDAGESEILSPQLPAWQWLAIVLGPKLLLVAVYWLHCALVRWRLTRSRNLAGLRWLQASGIAYRWLLIASFGQDLYFGALVALRRGCESLLGIANPILVDEVIMMAPPLLTLVAMWWIYYPIDRRIREASLIRDLDEGRPICHIWSRREYLLSQIRHNLAFMLLPLLLIVGWMEIIDSDRVNDMLGGLAGGFFADWKSALVLVGVGCVFLVSPLLIRRVWDTAPMPAGELRDRLTAMCQTHRIGIRQLLVWRTYGAMINAAVIGVIAPLRYILITDALLETLPARDVEAVMAHEIAHVRRHHMFWMMSAAIALLMGAQWLCWSFFVFLEWGSNAIATTAWPLTAWLTDPAVQETIMGVGTVVGWLIGFGWISRRFERQADTFAVQHLTTVFAGDELGDAPADNPPAEPDDDEDPVTDDERLVHPQAVATMSGALGRVATLNHMPAQRRGWWARIFDWLPDSSVWRHGSIAWRQAYLQTLIGQRVDNLSIDRQVRRIKLVSAIAIVAMIFLDLWQ